MSCTEKNPCLLIVCEDCRKWTAITDVHVNPIKPERVRDETKPRHYHKK